MQFFSKQLAWQKLHGYQFLWTVVLIALCVKTILKPLAHSVFPLYHQAGWNWWHNESLYQTYPGIDYFRYSPLAAIFFSAFSLFGVTLGGILWNLASNAIYLWGCFSFWKKLPQTQPPANQNAFFLICLFGALSGIWNSQCNITVAGLLLLGIANLMANRDTRACLWLALAILLKINIAPVVCLLLIMRPLPLILRLAPMIALGLLLPFLTKPPAVVIFQYREWLDHLLATGSYRWPGFRDGWYLCLTFLEQFSLKPQNPEFWREGSPGGYQGFQVVGGLLGAWVALLWKFRGMPPMDWWPRAATLGMCWMMVLGPAIEFPSYGLLAPFLAWACTMEKAKRRGLLWTAAFFILVMGWKEFQSPFVRALPLAQASLPIGSLLFTVWLLRDGFSTGCATKTK